MIKNKKEMHSRILGLVNRELYSLEDDNSFAVLMGLLFKAMRDTIKTFDTPVDHDPKRIKFRRWHILARILYAGQIIGVVLLLYLHAFGIKQ